MSIKSNNVPRQIAVVPRVLNSKTITTSVQKYNNKKISGALCHALRRSMTPKIAVFAEFLMTKCSGVIEVYDRQLRSGDLASQHILDQACHLLAVDAIQLDVKAVIQLDHRD